MQQNNSIYTQLIQAKSGISIPVFADGKTVDSRYDPQKESLRIAQGIKADTGFLIILGIGSGCLIQTILQSRKNILRH